MDEIKTTITGTFREMKVGEVVINHKLISYNVSTKVSFRVLKEVDETEYRSFHKYYGIIPPDPFGRPAKYYEIVALD